MKKLFLCMLILAMGCGQNSGRSGVTPNGSETAAIQGPEAHGSEQGNGADYYSYDEGSAWFLGKSKVIHACYKIDPNFGGDPMEVNEWVIMNDIKKAFAHWAKYMDVKKINDPRRPEAYQFSTKLDLAETCQGNEDLTFYFGGRNSVVDPYITKSRIAIAKRQTYDSENGWSKGFVWVAPHNSIVRDLGPIIPTTGEIFPNWNATENLLAVLTHEIGHVYGCGHIDRTIMTANLFDTLPTNSPRRGLDNIDFPEELYICKTCGINFDGNIGVIEPLGDDKKDFTKLIAAFEFLTGRKPVGGPTAVHARVIGNIKTSIKLVVSDDGDVFEFPLALEDEGLESVSMSQERAFKTIITSQLSSGGSMMRDWKDHISSSIPGKIVTKTGKTSEIVLSRNMSKGPYEGPLRIDYVNNGKGTPLFTAIPKEPWE